MNDARQSVPTLIGTAVEALAQAAEAAEARGALDAATPCTEWSAGQVLEHAVLDQQIWASRVAGTPAPDGDAFAPTGDLVSSQTAAGVRRLLDDAGSVWSRVEPAGPVPTPLPQGDLPYDTALAMCALDAAVHAWDVTAALGEPTSLSDDAAAPMLDAARDVVEPLRAYGVFAPALEPQPGDGAAVTLLRYLGRDPGWVTAR
jgi:uncharacterized protein (TIGR03086 family)